MAGAPSRARQRAGRVGDALATRAAGTQYIERPRRARHDVRIKIANTRAFATYPDPSARRMVRRKRKAEAPWLRCDARDGTNGRGEVGAAAAAL